MSFDMNPADEDPHGECRHEIETLRTENAALKKDASRYRLLRKSHWSDEGLCVTEARNVKLGVDCPATERLDAALDKMLAELPSGPIANHGAASSD